MIFNILIVFFEFWVYESIFLCCAIDNIDEARFKRGTSNEEPINVFDFNKFHAVLFRNTSSVYNSDTLSSSRDVLSQILPDPSVNLVDLLRGSNLTSANSPNRFIGKDNMSPFLRFNFGCNRIELPLNDFLSLVCLSFCEGLSEAGDDVESLLESSLNLFSDELVALPKESPPL